MKMEVRSEERSNKYGEKERWRMKQDMRIKESEENERRLIRNERKKDRRREKEKERLDEGNEK